MGSRRIRNACAGAIAIAAVMPLSSAAAHPVDCNTGVTAAPAAVTFADWTDGCRYDSAPVAGDSTQTAMAQTAADPGNRPRGRLKQVGHEPLMNRGMNAAIAVHGDKA